MTDASACSIIGRSLARVQQMLQEIVASRIDVLHAAARRAVDAGGKLLRPRIVLLAHRALGGSDETSAIAFATTVELLHAASLVHDDINDESSTRRGLPTAHAELGARLALITGDFVFVRMLHALSASHTDILPGAIRLLADACAALVEGEAQGVLRAGDFGMTENEYFEIIGQKTAALFAASAELGAIAARAGAEASERMRRYGYELGLAYQIRDDILDIVASAGSLGKPVRCDLAQGKLSLAPLFALRSSTRSSEYLRPGADPAHVVQFLHSCGALDYAATCAADHASNAIRALEALPPSTARDGLSALASYAASIESVTSPQSY